MATEYTKTLTGRRDNMGDEPETLAEVAMTPAEILDEAVTHPERLLQTNNPLYGNLIAMRTSLLTEMEDATPEDWKNSYETLAIQALQAPPANDPLRPVSRSMLETNVAFTYVIGRMLQNSMPEAWTEVSENIKALPTSPQEQVGRGLQPDTAQAISRRFTTLFTPPSPAAK